MRGLVYDWLAVKKDNICSVLLSSVGIVKILVTLGCVAAVPGEDV